MLHSLSLTMILVYHGFCGCLHTHPYTAASHYQVIFVYCSILSECPALYIPSYRIMLVSWVRCPPWSIIMLFNGKSVILVYCEYPEEAPKPVSDTINIHPESVSSKVETEEKKKIRPTWDLNTSPSRILPRYSTNSAISHWSYGTVIIWARICDADTYPVKSSEVALLIQRLSKLQIPSIDVKTYT